jgi:quercetin dioxygenase-like cupin family protein
VSAPGVSVAHIDELASVPVRGEVDWRPVRHPFGIQAFGANAWLGDAGVEVIDEHDEREDGTEGHEELYVVVSGSATFTVDGDRMEAPAGTLVAVTDPGLTRKAVAEEDGTVVIAVGAPKGAPFRVAGWERNRLG